MMKKLKFCLLCCMTIIIVSCQTDPKVTDYFNRPELNECLTAFEPGFMYCNGKKFQIPAKLPIMKTHVDVDLARQYYSDKEFRLYKCLKFKRKKRCK